MVMNSRASTDCYETNKLINKLINKRHTFDDMNALTQTKPSN